MKLLILQPPFRNWSAISVSALLMLTGCAKQPLIVSDTVLVARHQIVKLPLKPTSQLTLISSSTVEPALVATDKPLVVSDKVLVTRYNVVKLSLKPTSQPSLISSSVSESVPLDPDLEVLSVADITKPLANQKEKPIPKEVVPIVIEKKPVAKKVISVVKQEKPIAKEVVPIVIQKVIQKKPMAKKVISIVEREKPAAKQLIPVALEPSYKPADSIGFWLGEANWAFEQDKLTTPKDESAYYFLTLVLAKEPRNPQALQSLERIVQRYYVLLRAKLNQDKVEQARKLLSRAKKVMPKHGQLAAMRALIESHSVAKKVAHVAGKVTSVPVLRTQKLLLPIKQIDQRGEQLALWLVEVAKKAHDLQATMLIVAPKDTQARWVYQVMNSADPEQRIRANIKHSRPARVEISYLARKDELEVYGN